MRRTSAGLWVPSAGRPEDPEPESPEPGVPGPEGGSESSSAAEEELRARLAAAEAEAQEHRESWRRVLADFENVRRRSGIELADARDRGRTEVLLPLIGILDDVDRALAAGAGEGAAGAGVDDPFRAGVRLIRTRIENLLRTQGVEEIPAAGAAFDPHVHEAVMQVPAVEVPAGHVAQVLAPGYRLGERVLRPARVAVAGGSSTDAE
jgi:molecular chaperone GrpE